MQRLANNGEAGSGQGVPMMFRLLALTLALVLGAPVQAQLYKWVDSNGRVQYSDKPPPAGATKEKKLNIPKNPPAAVPAAPAAGDQPAGPRTAAEKEMDFRKRKVEEEQSKQKSEAAEKENQERCISAQSQLRNFEEAGRVYTMNEKGERQYYDDEARMRGIEQARQDMAKYCK